RRAGRGTRPGRPGGSGTAAGGTGRRSGRASDGTGDAPRGGDPARVHPRAAAARRRRGRVRPGTRHGHQREPVQDIRPAAARGVHGRPVLGESGVKAVVVGSANMDLVATAPNLPRPGETVLGYDFAQVPGGKGANQAIAAARAGAEVAFVGAIGSDAFGVSLRARLVASAVDTGQLRVVYGASGVALILVDGAGENMIVVAPGANAALTSLTGPDLALIAEADVLLLQLEIPVETV